MYAIIETGGKQYKVENGDVIYIEKLDVEADSTITFDKVIAVGADDGIKVGAPYVDGASVSAKVVKNGKGKKIVVATYKPKKNEKRKIPALDERSGALRSERRFLCPPCPREGRGFPLGRAQCRCEPRVPVARA